MSMREFNALREYPQPKERVVGKNIRTIKNKIIASYRDERYYDGDRNNGYGGFKYDGRWKQIVETMTKDYDLGDHSSVLQVGCEKGFFLHDFWEKFPSMKLRGYEMSQYAVDNAMDSIKDDIAVGRYDKFPYEDKEFDFVIAIGVVYTLTLADAVSCLKEIQRVGKGKSFITLGSYKDDEGERLFKKYWSVLGSTILHVDEWVEVLKEAEYTGDYTFVTSDVLNRIQSRCLNGHIRARRQYFFDFASNIDLHRIDNMRCPKFLCLLQFSIININRDNRVSTRERGRQYNRDTNASHPINNQRLTTF